MDLAPGTLVDRYTVAGVIGHGGMSVVYKVRHNRLGSLHVLKVLTLASPDLRQRLVLEGQVQASLGHPNIVTVTDLVDLDGRPGLIMDWVDGPDLDTLLRSRPLTLAEIDGLARDILSAVGVAHARGVVHRDLKPANILISTSGGRLTPRVTDFGLARVAASTLEGRARTRTGTLLGTPAYMSPEQVRDSKHVGPQTDVFSLGVILYEMLTRKRAFEGADLYEIFTAIAEGRYTPVRELVPDVPERMERAIASALRVDPAARCRDCRELLASWNGPRRDSAPRRPVPTPATPTPARRVVPEPAPPVRPRHSSWALVLGMLLGSSGAALAGLGLVVAAVLVVVVWNVTRPTEVEGADTGFERERVAVPGSERSPALPRTRGAGRSNQP